MGTSRWYSHRADRVSHGRQLSIRRHNQQLFANKATLGPVRQIINNWLLRFCHIFDNLVDFQRPDWICRSFGSALKFTRLIQIPHMDERWKFFFVHTNRSQVRGGRLCNNIFSLIAAAGLLPVKRVTSLFRTLTTSASLFTHSVDRPA